LTINGAWNKLRFRDRPPGSKDSEEMTMKKTVAVSITKIVKEIDVALKKLQKGKALAAHAAEKKTLAARIRKIHKARKELSLSCPKGSKSMTIKVPTS
jgi:hypothetical protein